VESRHNPFRRRRPQPSRQPTGAALLRCYLDDADRMLRLYRAGIAAARPERVELPKTLLEMVRCLTLVRRLDPRDEAPTRGEVHAALWRALLATEALPPGAALDRQVARLADSWRDFTRITDEELQEVDETAGPGDLAALGALGPDDRAVGTACAGSTHSHPVAVQTRLRPHTPCPGLVEAAARAFAPV
jgi:hypothetical protein